MFQFSFISNIYQKELMQVLYSLLPIINKVKAGTFLVHRNQIKIILKKNIYYLTEISPEHMFYEY